jgi:predicted DNA-binding transcriptional regulator AlpA
MSEQTMATEHASAKRKPGRPHKPSTVATPLVTAADTGLRVLSRAQVAAMFGCSTMTIRRLQATDATFPKSFGLAGHGHNFLLRDIEEFLLRKARAGQDA